MTSTWTTCFWTRPCSMHTGSRGEPVLAAWGITTDGKPVFVGEPRANPPTLGRASLTHKRGLRDPVRPWRRRAINGIEAVFARSLRQKCLIHRCRNVLAKVPVTAQQEIKHAFWGSLTLKNCWPLASPQGRTWLGVQNRIDARLDLPVFRRRSSASDREQLTSYLRARRAP